MYTIIRIFWKKSIVYTLDNVHHAQYIQGHTEQERTMKRTVTGGFMMKGGIEDPRPLTTLERINAILELAYTLQGPKQDENNKLMGNNMEAKALAELVDFVNSDEQHRARLPFDRDDAAILQAARAIFPNAVFVESEMSLIDRVHMVHGEAPENLGTHVIISGGEVMEIGRLSPDHEGNYDSDYSSWNEDPF